MLGHFGVCVHDRYILPLSHLSCLTHPRRQEGGKIIHQCCHLYAIQTRTFSNASRSTSSLVLCISSDPFLVFRIRSSICTTSALHFANSASWILTSPDGGTESRRAIVSCKKTQSASPLSKTAAKNREINKKRQEGEGEKKKRIKKELTASSKARWLKTHHTAASFSNILCSLKNA